MSRRKLSEAIANNEELSFVFGQAGAQKISRTIEDTPEQIVPRNSVICSFTFVPDKKPVRHYYDPQELQQWAANDIKLNGIRSALWVRPHPNSPGKYELVAGLRRFKAAEFLELPTIPIKVFNWDNQTAFQAAVAENANRRDFSALEELDNTLRLLEIKLMLDTNEVISLLYRMNNASKGTTNQNVLVSSEAEEVKQIFNAFGKITWQSFVATRLPLLKKPNDILEAIRQGKIHYTKGILLASIKNDDIRQELLERVITEGLSLAAIKQLVQQLNKTKLDNSKSGNLKDRLAQTVQTAKRNKLLWEDSLKLRQLENLLDQLDEIVR